MDNVIFNKGNIISVNGGSPLRILSENEYSICVQDLLTKDFSVLDKREHSYRYFNPKETLKKNLEDILNQSGINPTVKNSIMAKISVRIDKLIID